MDRFEIRRAAPSDVPAIRACVAAAYARWVAVLGYEPYPVMMDYAAAVHEHEVWVVPFDGAVIGVLVLIDQAPKLLLDNVAVDPAHQGRGLGNLLLDRAQALAAQGGYRELRLYTNEKMTENRAWYVGHGFAEVGSRAAVRQDDRLYGKAGWRRFRMTACGTEEVARRTNHLRPCTRAAKVRRSRSSEE